MYRPDLTTGHALRMGRSPCRLIFISLVLAFSDLALVTTAGETSGVRFSYRPLLQATSRTLQLWVQSVNAQTGQVVLNGVDTRSLTEAFTCDFGDGTTSKGWFPQKHTYADTSRNYVVKVMSHYTDGSIDRAEVLVRFVGPSVHPLAVPDHLAVTIPDRSGVLASRMPGYRPSSRLTPMQAHCFDVVPREVIEYVLSLAAVIQIDLANGDVLSPDGNFGQIVLWDPALQGGGMYSLWYTTPVSFAASCDAMKGIVAYSSFFHEMGHNVTLNFPRDHHYGGKIDGNANAIYSETMAQIFQHATAYEMLNHADAYGLSEDLAYDIAENATATFTVVRDAHTRYLHRDVEDRFSSWNNPNTPHDETFDTFMTLAYKFIEHAELANEGFRVPVQRLCRFLGCFDSQWRAQFSQHQNSSFAESFRATLMVAALSYAAETDLREEFKGLSFPIDDATFEDLTGHAQSHMPRSETTFADLVSLSEYWLTDGCSPLNNWCGGTDRNGSSFVDLPDYTILAACWNEPKGPAPLTQEFEHGFSD